MLEGLVRRVLVERFGQFVHGVDEARLSSGLTSGELLLSNLRLRDEAAEVLGLAPAFELQHGTISQMRVALPGITNFGSKPVLIRIEDVFLVLMASKSSSSSTDMLQQSKSKARSKKQHEIESAMNAVLIELTGMMSQKQGSYSGGFIRSFVPVTVILANLRIEIANLHIRCEDASATQPGYDFAFGLSAQMIRLRAVNAAGEDAFISDSAAVSRRKIDVKNFAFYWDCGINPTSNPLWALTKGNDTDDGYETDGADDAERSVESSLISRMRAAIATEEQFDEFNHIKKECFVITPFSASCFVQINSDLQNFKTGRCLIDCVVPNLKVHLHTNQFKDAKSIVNYQVSGQKRIKAAEILLKLQSRRPSTSVSQSPQKWWTYAVLSTLELIRSRSESGYGEISSAYWRWVTLSSIGRDRRLYMEIFSRKLQRSAAQEQKKPAVLQSKPTHSKVKSVASAVQIPENLLDQTIPEISKSIISPEQDDVLLANLEDRLPVSLIVLLRSIVHQNAMVEQVIKEKVQTQNAPGYFSWMFSSSTNTSTAAASHDLSEEQKQAIRREADIICKLDMAAAPPDFEVLHVAIDTNLTCILYDSDASSSGNEQIIASVDANSVIKLVQHPHRSIFLLLLKQFRVSDHTSFDSTSRTVLSMYPSSEGVPNVLELSTETRTGRSSGPFDLTVSLSIETTKIIWSNSFFDRIVRFLHSGHNKSARLLFDAAFWQWTEAQQAFLLSALATQHKHKLSARIGVVSIILIDDFSAMIVIAFRQFSIHSEPAAQTPESLEDRLFPDRDSFPHYARTVAGLSQFQISLRSSENEDEWSFIDPFSVNAVIYLPMTGSGATLLMSDVSKLSLFLDTNRLQAMLKALNNFANIAASLFSAPVISNSTLAPTQTILRKIAGNTGSSLLSSSPTFSQRPSSVAFSPTKTVKYSLCFEAVALISSFSIVAVSVEVSGSGAFCLSAKIMGLDVSETSPSSGIDWTYLLQSNNKQGHCFILSWNSHVSSGPILISLVDIQFQWSPFMVQAFFDYIEEMRSIVTNALQGSSSQKKQTESSRRYIIELSNCSCIFNKMQRRIAQCVIPKGIIDYNASPYSVTLSFENSYFREISFAALSSTSSRMLLFVSLLKIEVDNGDPLLHWSAVKCHVHGCTFTFFNRFTQELVDYISNGVAGILFGYNPDRKDLWPDLSPKLDAPFCLVEIVFHSPSVNIPASSGFSGLHWSRGLLLEIERIRITNSAFAGIDGWRSAEWQVDIVAMTEQSIFAAPVTGKVVALFSTDPKSTRVPWMEIKISLEFMSLVFDAESFDTFRKMALCNIGESWVEPVLFPGEHEAGWFLDDILCVTGSTMLIELTVSHLILSALQFRVDAACVAASLNRHADYSMAIQSNVKTFEIQHDEQSLVKSLANSDLSLEWTINGDWRQNHVHVTLSRLCLFISDKFHSIFASTQAGASTVSPWADTFPVYDHMWTNCNLEQIMCDERRDILSASRDLVVNVECCGFDGNSRNGTISVVVPVIAVVLCDLIKIKLLLGHRPSPFNVHNILYLHHNWRCLNVHDLRDLLKDASLDSLCVSARILSSNLFLEEVLDQLENGICQAENVLSSLKRPRDIGLLVFFFGVLESCVNVPDSTLFGWSHTVTLKLISPWRCGIWPRRSLNTCSDVPRLLSFDTASSILVWSSGTFDRIPLSIPKSMQSGQFLSLSPLFSALLTEIQHQGSSSQQLASIFYSSMALTQKPTIVSSTAAVSTLSIDDRVILLLSCLQYQPEPIIPFRFYRPGIRIENALPMLEQWSRHILLGLAQFLHLCDLQGYDLQVVCDVLNNSLFSACQNTELCASSSMLHELVSSFRSDDPQNIQRLSVLYTGSCCIAAPSPTRSALAFKIIDVFAVGFMPTVSRDSIMVQINVGFTRTKVDVLPPTTTIIAQSLKMYRCNWTGDLPWSLPKERYLLFACGDTGPHGRDCDSEINMDEYFDAYGLFVRDITMKLSPASIFMSKKDCIDLAVILMAIPKPNSVDFREPSPTLSGKTNVSACFSLSLYVCNEVCRTAPGGIRDAVLSFSMQVSSSSLSLSSNGMITCATNPLLKADILKSRVAVWEPLVEKFSVAFSWTRSNSVADSANSAVSRSPSPGKLLLTAEAQPYASSPFKSNMINNIVILISDPVLINISADTVEILAGVLWSRGPAGLVGGAFESSSCAFTLRNFTGWPLHWIALEATGIIEDGGSSPLEVLGNDPWEPKQALSLSLGDSWKPMPNAFVGNIGSFLFPLIPRQQEIDPQLHRLPHQGLVLESSIEEGHTILSAHSSISYSNCTPLSLKIVLYQGPLGTGDSIKLNLGPLQRTWVPLCGCAWDEFTILVLNGQSEYHVGRMSHSTLRRKRRSEYALKASENSYLFLCASSGGDWPGKLAISIRAPLDVLNCLPYPIEIRANENSVKVYTIADGAKKQIDTMDGQAISHLTFRMPGFSWSDPITAFDGEVTRSGHATAVVCIRDDVSSLHVVAHITRDVSGDNLNDRALLRVSLFTRLWLINHVPGVHLVFGTIKGVCLPGQTSGEVLEVVYENQRWFPGKGWMPTMFPGDRPAWSDAAGHPQSMDQVKLPGPNWYWTDEWSVHKEEEFTDGDGWMYAKTFKKKYHDRNKRKYIVRRRRHIRQRNALSSTVGKGDRNGVCMFSPIGKKNNVAKRQSNACIRVKTSHSEWSAPLNLLHGTDTRALTLENYTDGPIIDIGINITAAPKPFQETWIATFVPRYIVLNSFNSPDTDVFIQQFSDFTNTCIARPHKQKAFFFHGSSAIAPHDALSTYIRIGVFFARKTVYWSSEFDINSVGLHVLSVTTSDGNGLSIQVQISLDRSSVIIFVGDIDPSRPRYVIRNELTTSISIKQAMSSKSFSTKIDSGSSFSGFAWDLLSSHKRSLCVNIDDTLYDVDIDRLGILESLSDKVHISVFADGDTNVLLVTSSERRARRLAHVYTGEYSDHDPSCLLRLAFHADEIGISLITPSRSELMFISLMSLQIVVAEFLYLENVEVTLDAVHIDNQLLVSTSHKPEFIFPNILRSICKDNRPFLWLQCVRSFHTPHMLYFKLVDIALEPFSLALEELYILAVLDFITSVQSALNSSDCFIPDVRAQDLFNLVQSDADSMGPSFQIANLMYFEVLRTPTIKIVLSVKKSQESLIHDYIRDRNGVSHLLGVLLTNLEAKPIKRVGHEYLHLCDRAGSLRDQLLSDYKGSLLLEFLGSFGYNTVALGGLVPVLSTLRAGVRKFRSEIAVSVRHGNIGRGILRGTFSLVDHTARGLMMPITGISAGFGDVISALTFDKEFGRRRAVDVANKPTNLVTGLLRGGRSIGLGVTNGLVALVREPIEEHRKRHGAAGIMIGIGKGLSQAVASPLVGVFDAINHVGTGLARTPDYILRHYSIDRIHDRVRLPRAFYGQGRTIGPYTVVDALLVEGMKTIKPPIDATLYAVFTGGSSSDSRAFALLTRGIAAFHIVIDRRRCKLLWFQAWSSIVSFELVDHGIKVFILGRRSSDAPWLLIWMSEPLQAYEMIVKMHNRHKSSLRVTTRSVVDIVEPSLIEVAENPSESII